GRSEGGDHESAYCHRPGPGKVQQRGGGPEWSGAEAVAQDTDPLETLALPGPAGSLSDRAGSVFGRPPCGPPATATTAPGGAVPAGACEGVSARPEERLQRCLGTGRSRSAWPYPPGSRQDG